MVSQRERKALGVRILRQNFINEVREVTIETALQAKQEEQKKGFPKDAIIVVDGQPFRRENTVRSFGRINYIARRNTLEIVEWFNLRLNKKSPKLTGKFRASNTFWFDNKQVDIDSLGPDDQDPKVVTILNKQPYAGRLEQGSSIKFPNGIYKPLVKTARRKFGSRSGRASGKATITFKWIRSNTIGDEYLRPLITIRKR